MQNEPASIVILRDGQSLHVRPVTREDRERIRELFYRITPQSRYLRFQYQKDRITDTELDDYTTQNPPDIYTVVATVGEAAAERVVAVASWFLTGGDRSAEVAFLVEDTIQLRGIGTALLEQLSLAAEKHSASIKRFVASVLPENTRMLDVFMDSGFNVVRKLDGGVYHLTIDLEEQAEFSRRQSYREHIARAAGIRRFMNPRTVAVIGASRNPATVSGAVFRNLLLGGFQGAVFPVNPNAASVAGVLAYPSVMDIPADVDLAVIVVPAPLVLGVVDECGRKGIERIVIITAGFGEAGEEGRDRQLKLKEKALSYGMRLIGPNCLGIINTEPLVRMNATFSPIASPSPGSICIGSHSGALGLALLDYAENHGIGIRSFVSIGNRVDISSNDLLEYWEDDPDSRVIALYLESFGNPRKFSRIARRVSRKKPVIAVKAGKSAVGARAATSHTGALAAADVAVDAMFRKAGVIRVNTIQEMFNVLRLLAHQPAPSGPRLGIITNAGGPGVLAADAAEGWGLTVPTLSDESQARLRGFLPKEAAVANPVDMIASAAPESYGKALEVMLDDPAVDAVIFIYIPPLVTQPEDVAASVRAAMKGYAGDKPVLACFMMLQDDGVDLCVEDGRCIPSFVFPEEAVQALARSYQHREHSLMPEGAIPKFHEVDTDAVRAEFFRRVPPRPEGAWAMPEDAAWLLAAYGIPVAGTRPARSAEEAVEAANAMGYPVVMKVRSGKIVHKSDIGGIALDLRTERDVIGEYYSMRNRLTQRGVLDRTDGVIVSKMCPEGLETIVGMAMDPVFGPLVMLGLGGTAVEVSKDIAFALHPLVDLDPERMLRELKGKALFGPWRGSAPRDTAALNDVLLRFSALIDDFPEISECEINPLTLYGEGGGAMAVDFRMLIKPLT